MLFLSFGASIDLQELMCAFVLIRRSCANNLVAQWQKAQPGSTAMELEDWMQRCFLVGGCLVKGLAYLVLTKGGKGVGWGCKHAWSHLSLHVCVCHVCIDREGHKC
eukprot:scaffold73895_cov19-Tisochrysis_lutea.AAC.1